MKISNFKEALAALQKAETAGRDAQRKLDKARMNFQAAKEIINNQFEIEWRAHCAEKDLYPSYDFNDTLA